MIRLASILTVFLLLAGCADSGNKQAGTDSGGDKVALDEGLRPTNPQEDAENLNRESSGSRNLKVTQTTGAGRNSMATNCASVRDTDVWQIHSMNVTMSWQALAPTQQTLELLVFGDDTRQTMQGSSPLQMTVENVKPEDFFEAIFVMGQAARPAGIAIEQAIVIDYTMIYDGVANPNFRTSTCAFS